VLWIDIPYLRVKGLDNSSDEHKEKISLRINFLIGSISTLSLSMTALKRFIEFLKPFVSGKCLSFILLEDPIR